MTIDQAMVKAAAGLDSIIEEKLAELEARISRDIAATGPEDESALDVAPSPDSPWRRVTVEETVMMQRERLLAWRADTLAEIRTWLEGLGSDGASAR